MVKQMSENRVTKYLWGTAAFLIIAIAVGSTLLISGLSADNTVEINITSPAPAISYPAEVYIGGAVTNRGYFPLRDGDSIDDLIEAAGGVTDDADLNQLNIYIPANDESVQPQRININCAEAWLLEALPGIGSKLAHNIINYRTENGHFRSIGELSNVEGIGPATYEKLEELITVED